ncbi:MAG: hypothetical protein ACK42A_05260 [Pyrinomonadaceae bacterium]
MTKASLRIIATTLLNPSITPRRFEKEVRFLHVHARIAILYPEDALRGAVSGQHPNCYLTISLAL